LSTMRLKLSKRRETQKLWLPSRELTKRRKKKLLQNKKQTKQNEMLNNPNEKNQHDLPKKLP